jgi:predicted NBD/HSP70 family sugar kinase
MNTSAALAYLLDRGPLTRGDLREYTGLSKPTTSEVLRKLTDAGLAMVTGYTAGGPGPNAEIYVANPDAAYAVAVSVREPTTPPQATLAVAITDLAGAIRARTEIDAKLSPRNAGKAIATAIRRGLVDADIPAERVRLVQLAVPGSYDAKTDTIHHIDVPGMSQPGLVTSLAADLRTTVAVDNNVNLAAVAERRRGVAKDIDSFALIWLGSGLGLAIDLGGSLLRGARGGAGEIGYMPVGLAPESGPQPDLHDTIADDAVLALAWQHGVEATSAAEAVAADDPEFILALAGRIAHGVAAVIAVLDPHLVVLAGEVGHAGGARLASQVRHALRSAAPLDAEIEPSGVADDAVLLGALDAALSAVRERLVQDLQDQLTPVP